MGFRYLLQVGNIATGHVARTQSAAFSSAFEITHLLSWGRRAPLACQGLWPAQQAAVHSLRRAGLCF